MSSVTIARPWLGLEWPLHYLREVLTVLGVARCRLMHRAISRPVNGRYRCWVCLREFPARW